jgi:group II intron reverse transcriptase/maturase
VAGIDASGEAAAPVQPPLDQILDLKPLRQAWQDVRANKGSYGRDGVTIRRFERLLDANLLTLADDVRGGTYAVGAPRRIRIRTGRKVRTISLLNVRDRVLQRAVLDALTPSIDRQFLSSSYGYRPGRSLHDAVSRIVTLRNRGFAWVVDADIDDCFGSLSHELIERYLTAFVDEQATRSLIMRWVRSSDRHTPVQAAQGIELGAVISPLLCNIYLHQLDLALRQRRYQLVRYADDFLILCRDEALAQRALRSTQRILHGLRLAINEEKTRTVSFEEGFDFLGVRFEGDRWEYSVFGKRVVVEDRPPNAFRGFWDGYGRE